MSPVWTPQKQPPDPRQMSGLSPEAELVWQALMQRHVKASIQRDRPPTNTDSSSYYQTLYKQAFGRDPYNSQTVHDSQVKINMGNASQLYTSQNIVSSTQPTPFLSHTLTQPVHHPYPFQQSLGEACGNDKSDPRKIYTSYGGEHATYTSAPSNFETMEIDGSSKLCIKTDSSFKNQKNGDPIHAFDPLHDFSQSLFTQTQNVCEPDSSGVSSPLLEFENDDVLSQLPKMPANQISNDGFPNSDQVDFGDQFRWNPVFQESRVLSRTTECEKFDFDINEGQSLDFSRFSIPLSTAKNINQIQNIQISRTPNVTCTITSPTENVGLNNSSVYDPQKRPAASSEMLPTTTANFRIGVDSSGTEHAEDSREMENCEKGPRQVMTDVQDLGGTSSKNASVVKKATSGSISSRLKQLRDSSEHFQESSSASESIITVGLVKAKKSLFHVPNKKKKLKNEPEIRSTENSEPEKDAGSHCCVDLDNARDLSSQRRADIEAHLDRADEVAITLVYTDRSTQLREIVDKKRKSSENPQVYAVAVAYPLTTEVTKLAFISFPILNKSQETSVWTRKVLKNLMAAKTRKLVFEAQELIATLLDLIQIDEKRGTLEWSVLDPKVGCWLLDPDNAPVTFTQVLATLSDISQVSKPSHDEQLCEDLSLLGPVMLQLYHKLKAQNLWTLFTKLEMPLCPILAAMERRGLTVDTKIMIQSGDLLQKKLLRLEKEAYKAAGHSFLISSHPQLRQILFEELKLDQKLPHKTKIARTAANQHKSTSESVLKQLSPVHTLPGVVLEHRQVQKVKSTYVDGLLPYVKNGLLHTHWDHTSAVTGRLTSTNPNIQAIPKQPLLLEELQQAIADKEVDPVEIYARAPFITPEGYSFVAADFQQIELRLLAHLSEDPSLLAVFQRSSERDIFIELTSQWLNKSIDEVTTSDREQTKRVVYSVTYGVGKERLAEYLSMTPDEAKGIMNSFLVTFPAVNTFTRKCVTEARGKGYQCTILNRRRWFPQIKHPNPQLRAQSERQAVNFCVQGSAADLCKAAMIQVEHALAEKPHLKARLLVQIHDELLLEMPDHEIAEVTDLVKSIMENAEGLCGDQLELRVPLRVSFSRGKSWGHMETFT